MTAGVRRMQRIAALVFAPSPLEGGGNAVGHQNKSEVRGYGPPISRDPSPGLIVSQRHVGPLPQGERVQQAAPHKATQQAAPRAHRPPEPAP